MTSDSVFFLQALVIAFMYLGMRRDWLPTRMIVIGGVAANAILMFLRLALTQGADTGRALMIGVPLGAVIGLAVASIAWYFMLQEQQNKPSR